MKDPKFTNILVRFSCPHGTAEFRVYSSLQTAARQCTAVHGTASHSPKRSARCRVLLLHSVESTYHTSTSTRPPQRPPTPHANLRCLHTRAHVKNLDCASAAGLGGREVREQSAPSRFRCREQEVEGRRGARLPPHHQSRARLRCSRYARGAVWEGQARAVA